MNVAFRTSFAFGLICVAAAVEGNAQEVVPPPQFVNSGATAVSRGFVLAPNQLVDLLDRARKGDVDSAFRLASHYKEDGDAYNARYWLLVAALRGHAVAQYNEWFSLRESSDCARIGEALAWLEAASNGGSTDARGMLSSYKIRAHSCDHAK